MRDLHHVPDDVLDTRLDNGMTHRQWLQRQAYERAEAIKVAPPRPSNYGQPIRFGDDSTRAAHERKCLAIRQRMHGHEFQVAPSHTVVLPNGSRLHEGSEVTVAMFAHAPLPAGSIHSYLVRSGVVLESLVYDPRDNGPQAA